MKNIRAAWASVNRVETRVFLRGPLAGSLALAMMGGNGSIGWFFSLWGVYFTLAAAFSYRIDRFLTARGPQPLNPRYPAGFAWLLGLPLMSIISGMFSFRANASNVVISVLCFFHTSFPAWRPLILRLRREFTWPGFIRVSVKMALVAAVLAAGLAVRLGTVPRGLPYEYYWDEPFAIGTALRMFRDHTLHPHFFDYPSFIVYLQWLGVHVSYAILKAHREIASRAEIITGFDVPYLWTISHSLFWYVGRIVQVGYAMVGLVAVFLLGQALSSFGAGLLALGLCAFSHALIIQGGWISVDLLTSTNSLLWALVLTAAQRADTAPGRCRLYRVAAFLAGVTLSTKYNAIPIMLPTLLFPWFNSQSLEDRPRWRTMAAALGISMLGFFAVTPYAIFDFGAFVSALSYDFKSYAVTGFSGEIVPGFSAKWAHDQLFLSRSLPHGTQALIAFWLASALVVLRGPRWAPRAAWVGFLFLYPVTYLLFMAKMKAPFDRNLLLVIPFLAVAFGWWISEALRIVSKPLENRFWRGRPFLQAAGGILVACLLLGRPVIYALSSFHGMARLGDDSRTSLMQTMRDEVKRLPATAGVSWVIQESLIHPEETGRDRGRFVFLGAQEAWRLWQAGERPPFLITSELDAYPQETEAANRALIQAAKLRQSAGSGPVRANLYVSSPKVLLLQGAPSRP